MGMNYSDYKAAVERLRRLESEESASDVYGPECPYRDLGVDKALIYDAEHDQTPASVKWIVDNFGGEWKHGNCLELKHFQIWDHADEGVVILDMGHSEIENPTRGQVLKAAWLFGENKGVARAIGRKR